MTTRAQKFYDDLVEGLFASSDNTIVLSDALLNFISDNLEDENGQPIEFEITRFDTQVGGAEDLAQGIFTKLVKESTSSTSTFLDHLEATKFALTTVDITGESNYRELFLESFTKQITKKIEESKPLSVAEIKFVLKFKDALEGATSVANLPILGSDFGDFTEKLAEKPDIIPANELFFDFNQFDLEVSKYVKESIKEDDTTTYEIGDATTLLHTIKIAGDELAGTQEKTQLGLAGTGDPLGRRRTEAMLTSTFEKIAELKPEVAALKLTSISTNAQQTIGSNQIANLKDFSEEAKKVLIDKWIIYLEEIFINGTLIQQANNFQVRNASLTLIPIVLVEFENLNREALWNQIKDSDPDEIAEDDLKNQAQQDALQNAKEAGTVGDLIETALTKEQIAERQTYRDQCILMARMDILSGFFLSSIGSKEQKLPFHKNKIFDERFYMVHSADSGNFVNNIFASRGEPLNQFLNMTPDIQAFFVPKIKIFKVFNDEDGSLKQIEFPFSAQTHDDNIVNQLFGDATKPFRGGGYGIKSFSFDFEGGNPTTARRDITAKLSLFFQDFNDFVHEFRSKDTDGKDQTIRFVDMILFDSSRAYPNGINDYKPSYYRIRADVGWHVPGTQFQEFKKVCTARGFSALDLLKCVRETNKTFYLNMVEHTIDFTEQGTANINIEYRAYIESELKSNHLDALANPEILKERIQRAETLNKLYTDSDCKQKDLTEIQNAFQALKDNEKDKLHQSLIDSLLENDKIYKVSIETDGGFSTAGYFNEPPKIKYNVVKGEFNPDNEDADSSETASVFDTINFFFLGDLLYIMLDTLHDKNLAFDKINPLGEKIRFVLPSITVQDQFNPGKFLEVNLAQIPISIQYFKEWINEFVLDEPRENYPIMNFLRDLLNNLIADMLIETCYNRQADKSFNFITTAALSYENKMDGIPKHLNKDNDKDQPIIDLEIYDDIFPLVTNRDDNDNIVPIKDIYTYIIIIPNYKNPNPKGVGNYSDDLKKGIPHFEIGLDRGILKTAKFSKTDMQYIREARFFQNGGVDDMLQLAAVYSVDLKLFGNCLFFPGMEIFVNPYSFGGEEFLPNVRGSIASKLGFGGYHLITKVNSEISPGNFNTNVKALYLHSGDRKEIYTGGVAGSRPTDGKPDNTSNIQDANPQSPEKLDCQKVRQAAFDSATSGTPLVLPSAQGNVEERQEGASEERDAQDAPAEETVTAVEAEEQAAETGVAGDGDEKANENSRVILIESIKAALSNDPRNSGTIISQGTSYNYTYDSNNYNYSISGETGKEEVFSALAVVENGTVRVAIYGGSN